MPEGAFTEYCSGLVAGYGSDESYQWSDCVGTFHVCNTMKHSILGQHCS